MSTRGWYEYYVIEPTTNLRTLAMQFYKWSDAVPEHALEEWNRQGGDLLAELEDYPDKAVGQAEYDREQANRLLDLIAENHVDRFSLREAGETFPSDADAFWGPDCHERPSLPPATAGKRHVTGWISSKGPYAGDADKTRFVGITAAQASIKG